MSWLHLLWIVPLSMSAGFMLCAVLTAGKETGGDQMHLRHELAFAVADTCVCCGTPVPEGRMVCPSCEEGVRK